MRTKTAAKAIRIIVILGLFGFSSATGSSADNLPAESKITRVTVYPGSARVTRQAKVDLSAGEQSIIFENINSFYTKKKYVKYTFIILNI